MSIAAAIFEAAIPANCFLAAPDSDHLKAADGAGLHRHRLVTPWLRCRAFLVVHVG
jgi:hypothetical protein